MKILYLITKAETGGAQNFVKNLANSLSKENNFIISVLADSKGEMWDLLDNNVKKIKLPRITNTLNPFRMFYDLIRIFKQIKTIRPNVIHCNSSYMGLIGRILGFILRVPTIYTVHGFDTILKKYKFALFLEKLLSKTCFINIAVSKYDKKNLIKNGIVNVDTIYNGVEQIPKKDFEFNNIKSFINKYKKLNYKIFVTAARLSQPKDPSVFIKMSDIMKKNKIALVWFGEGPLRDNLNKTENIIFPGNLINVSSYFHYFDGFVLASNYEGFPISILEALKTGLPVISSNVGGVSEIIENNANGFLINDNANKDKWIEAFEKCDKNLMKSNIKKSIANFELDIMISKYKNYYYKASK